MSDYNDTQLTSLVMHSLSDLDLVPQRESDIGTANITDSPPAVHHPSYDVLQNRLKANKVQLQELQQTLRQDESCKSNMRCEPCKMQRGEISENRETSLKSDQFRPVPLPESSRFHQIGIRPREIIPDHGGKSEQIVNSACVEEQDSRHKHVHIHIHHYNESNTGTRNVKTGLGEGTFMPWVSVNMPLQMDNANMIPASTVDSYQKSNISYDTMFEQSEFETARKPISKSVLPGSVNTKRSRTRERLSSHKVISTKVKRFSPVVSPALSFRKKKSHVKTTCKSPRLSLLDINNNESSDQVQLSSVVCTNISSDITEKNVIEDVPRRSAPTSVCSSQTSSISSNFSLQKDLDLTSVSSVVPSRGGSFPFRMRRDEESGCNANSTPIDSSLLYFQQLSEANTNLFSQKSVRGQKSDLEHVHHDRKSKPAAQCNSKLSEKSGATGPYSTRSIDNARTSDQISLSDPIMLYSRSKQVEAVAGGKSCNNKQMHTDKSLSISKTSQSHKIVLPSNLPANYRPHSKDTTRGNTTSKKNVNRGELSTNLAASYHPHGRVKTRTNVVSNRNLSDVERNSHLRSEAQSKKTLDKRPSVQRRKLSSSTDPFKTSLRNRKKSFASGHSKDHVLLELCDVLSTELIHSLSHAHHDKLYELAAVCREVKRMKSRKAKLHGQVEESNQKVLSLINVMQNLAITSSK